jgi:signal transduction histidine kinase
LGFSGFSAVFSRYFLNIGTPFELWLKRLSALSQQEPNPDIFLKLAVVHLAELPWLVGLYWSTADEVGQHGERSAHHFEVQDQDLCLVVFTRHSIAPSVLMHVQLQCQMLAYFYHSKRREQRLAEMARLQAVHETGARLTHDLKNMLQSLFALMSIAEQKPEQAQPILQKQLPMMVERIQSTLDKLKLPKTETEMSQMPLLLWWQNLQQRQQFRHVDWASEGELENKEIPAALLDSVLDNLIENARNKRLRETDIKVQVHLCVKPFCLTVCDSGSEIPAYVERKLMSTVIGSEDGLGIGLYQAARWAEQHGYSLRLKENVKGRVCFELTEVEGRV